MDSIMVVGVFVMMLLYGGYLTWIVLGFTMVYVLIRLVTYGYYRQISEETLVRGPGPAPILWKACMVLPR